MFSTIRHQWHPYFWRADDDSAALNSLDKSRAFSATDIGGLTLGASYSIGALLTLIGALCASLGSVWEARPAAGYSFIGADNVGNTYLDVAIGVIIWLFGSALHVLGLFFAPASLLAPVNSTGLVCTMFLSWYLLGDRLNLTSWLSCLGILIGVMICLRASSSSDAAPLTAERRIEVTLSSWKDPYYLAFFSTMLVLGVILSLLLQQMSRRREEYDVSKFRNQSQLTHIWTGSAIREFYVSTKMRERANALSLEATHTTKASGLVLALLAGICGSQTVCQIKELEAFYTLTRTRGWSSLWCLQFVWALSVFAVSAVVQFPLVSTAFNIADHDSVSALYHVAWTTLSVIGGLLKFKEYQALSSWNLFLFGLGFLCTLTATYFAAAQSIKIMARVIRRENPFSWSGLGQRLLTLRHPREHIEMANLTAAADERLLEQQTTNWPAAPTFSRGENQRGKKFGNDRGPESKIVTVARSESVERDRV